METKIIFSDDIEKNIILEEEPVCDYCAERLEPFDPIIEEVPNEYICFDCNTEYCFTNIKNLQKILIDSYMLKVEYHKEKIKFYKEELQNMIQEYNSAE